MDRFHVKPKDLSLILPYVTSAMGIDDRLKELVIMDYWNEIVKGSKAKESKPHSILKTRNGLLLRVGARSSVVAYELNLIKHVLIDQLNKLAIQVGLKVFDINISTTYWTEDDDMQQPKEGFKNHKNESEQPIKSFDPAKVDLTEEQQNDINQTIANSELDENMKKRLKAVMEKDLKFQNYKKSKGYPKCETCQVYLDSYQERLCPSCKYK